MHIFWSDLLPEANSSSFSGAHFIITIIIQNNDTSDINR